MNICWEILGIEPTTDLECIRQAYLALLPSFHPESDPQGFKRLRQAYEEAQHWAASPAEDAKMEEVGDEHEILVAFRELLASERDRFQPSAWQKFIQQLNQCSMDEIDKLRWQLCDIAMKTETISLSCLALLAQRLNWQPQEAEDDADGEELEAFLETVKRGDAFDLLSLAKLPLVVQDQTDAYFFKLEHIWRFYPEHFADALQVQGAWIIPDDKQLHRKLLHWFSAEQWGMAELVDIARRWQAAEPDNEDAHYYLCKQRLLCGEGESLLADILHSGRLSPLGRSFVDSLFYKRKAMAWANSRLSTQGEPETPLLDLYRTAEQVVLEAFPKEKPFFRLLIRLEEGQSCPLEALITQALSSKIAMKPGDIRDKKELAEELRLAAEKEETKLSSEAKTEAPRQAESGGVMKIMKIVGLIALIVCALNRFFHFF
ncbi:J domain-containing protein [Salmonella enterica]|nr:J domain-containing protein [Salmonella enterica]